MRTLNIELTPQSCEAAAREVAKYERGLSEKMSEVCRRLAEIGRQEVISIIDNLPQDEGNFVERVDVLPTENGWKLVMEGEDVYFIEFGTGDGVVPHYDTSVPVAWGTWSAEHEQMLWKRGFWYYDGTKFTGTKAYMPMFYAEQRMREEEANVIREVFG